MAKCDLTIHLERPDGRYRLGETVGGTLEVRVDADCRCDGLTITHRWETHGRGNRAYGPEQELQLFAGQWRSGEVLEYPFEFELRGPLTYRGHYLNVDHYLRARADIPWAFDPKAEAEVLVELGDDPGAYDAGLGPEAPEGKVVTPFGTMTADQLHGVNQHSAKLLGMIVAVVVGVFFVLPGLGMALAGLILAFDRPPALIMVPFGLVFASVGGFVIYRFVRNSLAERRLGAVDLRVTPQRCPPGQRLEVSLGFTPEGDVELNQVTAVLIGRERVVSGSGTNRTTHTHQLHKEEITLDGRGRIQAGQEVLLEGILDLPADAALSLRASDNTLEWAVEAHIDIASWPDWSRTVVVDVAPPQVVG